MSLRSTSVKISGVPNDSGWSQSFEYVLEGEEKKRASFLAVVFSTIRRNAELNDAVAGREFLNRFKEEFYSDGGKTVENCLKERAHIVKLDSSNHFD